MTVALRDFSALDATQVGSNLSETVQRVQEDNPKLDLRFGVLNNILAYYHALLGTQLQVNVSDYLSARSLLDIQNNPTLADADNVDAVLSNFLLTRKDGGFATGEVTIVLSDNITVTIAAGATFVADGQQFETTQVFVAKSEAAQVTNAGDRLITPIANDRFAFTITVQAVVEGVSSNIKKDVLVVPDSQPANYVTSYATSDFTGGINPETNAELLARLQQGIATKGLSNRVNMQAFLRTIDAFSRVVAQSIVGMGNSEMLRDKHTIFPVSFGGRVDWYIRTLDQVQRLSLTKTATCIAVDPVNIRSTWQFSLARDDAPGLYEVANIRLPSATNAAGGFEIISDIRGMDLTGPAYVPDIINETEAAYTRYSTAVIQFVDTVTDPSSISVGSTADYNFEAHCLPLIADIQDTMIAFDTRSMPSDILVKAPVPCFVQVSFTITKAATDSTPDTAAIAAAVCNAINTVGFTGQVYSSRVQDAIQSLLTGTMNVGALDLFGRVRYPSGAINYVRATTGGALTAPVSEGNMVSTRTVQFFTSPDDVAITVVTAAPTTI